MRIVVIDPQEEISMKLQKALLQFHMQEYEIHSFIEWDEENVKEATCIIIDSKQIKEIKDFMLMAKKYSVNKVIILTDRLNHSISPSALMLGATIFYRNAPITSLLYKIYDSYKPVREVPKTISYEEVKKEMGVKLVAVHSPKGGTGKTTISINLAIQYAKKGLKVLLIDLALYGNIGVNLKINQRGTGLSSILTNLEHTTEEYKNYFDTAKLKEHIYPYINENQSLAFDVIIAANPLKMEKLTIQQVEMILIAVGKMDYDIIIIDTSSELSERNLAVFEMVNEIIMVAAPEINSGWNLIQLKEILDNIGVSKKCKLVVNLYSKYVGFSCKELEMELQTPLIGIIPYQTEIQYLHNQGIPVGFKEKQSINMYIKRLGQNIIPIFSPKETKTGNLLGFLNIDMLIKRNKDKGRSKKKK